MSIQDLSIEMRSVQTTIDTSFQGNKKLGEKRQGLSEKTIRLGTRNKYHRAHQATVVQSVAAMQGGGGVVGTHNLQ